jgi:hypothetical protein
MNAKNYFASFDSRPPACSLVPKSPYSLPCSPLHLTLLTLTRAFVLALLFSEYVTYLNTSGSDSIVKKNMC